MAVERVELVPSHILNLLGALALLALGLYVLFVKPRRAGNLALAAFALGLGLRFTISNLASPIPAIFVLTEDDPRVLPIAIARVLGWAIAATGAACVVILVPRAIDTKSRLVLPAALALAHLGAASWAWNANGVAAGFRVALFAEARA